MKNFKDKYTTPTKKQKDSESEGKKDIISEDAFAIGEMMQEILFKLEHLRIGGGLYD